jgi:glucosyl-dolichyl phosphate glucuronosyltransferase
MLIDVIISTYNRSAMLARAVRSVLDSGSSSHFDFSITIVDNNSKDDTREVVARLEEESGGRVRYSFEPRQGRSYAVNTGFAETRGDVIAFADDDQWMGREWLHAIYESISAGYDYLAGPVYGDWEMAPPPWYDNRLRGVLSLNEDIDLWSVARAGESLPGFQGGNSAVRRQVFDRLGGYHVELGKRAGTLLMCEDSEFYLRLAQSGFRGVFNPRMKVFHYIPRERLTRRYFRSWYRSYGSSMALIDKLHPKPVSYICGVPRFLWRQTIEALPRMLAACLRGDRPGIFKEELNLWFMTGFIEGKLLK